MDVTGRFRPLVVGDVAGLKGLIDATGLFPSDMLDTMLAPYFEPGGQSQDHWLTEDTLVSVAYCAPERMTEGTWNLLLIAVHPDFQGQGRGTALLRQVEAMLAARGERLLLVETSGLAEFELTRSFYRRTGYREEARIRDFYQAGEDKIVFVKALQAGG